MSLKTSVPLSSAADIVVVSAIGVVGTASTVVVIKSDVLALLDIVAVALDSSSCWDDDDVSMSMPLVSAVVGLTLLVTVVTASLRSIIVEPPDVVAIMRDVAGSCIKAVDVVDVGISELLISATVKGSGAGSAVEDGDVTSPVGTGEPEISGGWVPLISAVAVVSCAVDMVGSGPSVIMDDVAATSNTVDIAAVLLDVSGDWVDVGKRITVLLVSAALEVGGVLDAMESAVDGDDGSKPDISSGVVDMSLRTSVPLSSVADIVVVSAIEVVGTASTVVVIRSDVLALLDIVVVALNSSSC